MAKEFYTVREFAKEIGFSTDRVYEWLRSGRIKHLDRITTHSVYRIPKIEVDRLLGRQEVVPSQGETTSEKIVQEAQLHDRGIFENSDGILSEYDFEKLFEFLSRNSFLGSQLDRLLRFLEHFDSEGNKYADGNLNYVYLKLCQNLHELSELIQIDSVERTRIAGVFDTYREKSVDDEWSRLLKKLLENTPDSDSLEMDELYLIIDGRGSTILLSAPEFSDTFHYESYIEWQREFDKLVARTQASYKECRAAVRETLYL